MKAIRTAALVAVLLAVSCLLSPLLCAQQAVVHDQPVRVRHLAGVVVDAKGLFIAYPAVELRDAESHKVLATTFADGNGKFSFPDRKRGARFEIRFSLSGFQSVQYTVILWPLGRQGLRAVLPAAV